MARNPMNWTAAGIPASPSIQRHPATSNPVHYTERGRVLPTLVHPSEGPADDGGHELAGHHQGVVADSEGAAQRGRGRLG